MAKAERRPVGREIEATLHAWHDRLLQLDEEIGALAADWPLERSAHPDLLAAVDIARDGLAFMLPTHSDDTRDRMRRMRNAQLGVKGTGDHRGLQMATAASVVLEVVRDLRDVPEHEREGRIELATQHLTRMLAAHLPAQFSATSEASALLQRARAKRRLLEWASRYTAKRPKPHSHGMTLAAITAHVLHEAGAFGLARNPPEDEIADTTKALGVQIARYGLHRKFGPRAELARRQR